MLKHNLNDTRFVTTGNKEGLSNADTVFHYFQQGGQITGHYAGGGIQEGQVVGKATGPAEIQLLFQCLTNDGELLSGCSVGSVRLEDDGRLALSFDWSWLNSQVPGGTSSYIQLR